MSTERERRDKRIAAWLSGLALSTHEHDRQIAFQRGVEQERERCAKIAEDYLKEMNQLHDWPNVEDIAARIRRGK